MKLSLLDKLNLESDGTKIQLKEKLKKVKKLKKNKTL